MTQQSHCNHICLNQKRNDQNTKMYMSIAGNITTHRSMTSNGIKLENNPNVNRSMNE